VKLEEMNVHEEIIKGLRKSNLDEITSLQQNIVYNVTNGRNLVVKTGDEQEKLISIAITVLDTAYRNKNNGGPVCLVLAPTSDRVRGIHKQISGMAASGFSCVTIDETGKESRQRKFLEEEPTIIIATPTQLQTVMRAQRYVFRHIRHLVLDGLDEMIADGQSYPLKQIRLRTFSDHTSLIFASDMGKKVKETTAAYTQDPVVVGFTESQNGQMAPPPVLSPALKQNYINVPSRMKISTLMAYIGENSVGRCIIFTASKRGTNRLYKVLKKQNLQSVSLHERLSKGKKTGRFKQFTSGKVPFLLVADISAAELELNDIDQVINYDVPDNTDEYRYRAALLQSGGSACITSLVSGQDRGDIRELQKKLNTELDELTLPASVRQKVENRKEDSEQSKQQQRKKEMELPRPSYDKLSGGRKGDHDEKQNQLVKFFKRLFTS
jgi:superfamily II DNA/RNA helicase